MIYFVELIADCFAAAPWFLPDPHGESARQRDTTCSNPSAVLMSINITAWILSVASQNSKLTDQDPCDPRCDLLRLLQTGQWISWFLLYVSFQAKPDNLAPRLIVLSWMAFAALQPGSKSMNQLDWTWSHQIDRDTSSKTPL